MNRRSVDDPRSVTSRRCSNYDTKKAWAPNTISSICDRFHSGLSVLTSCQATTYFSSGRPHCSFNVGKYKKIDEFTINNVKDAKYIEFTNVFFLMTRFTGVLCTRAS